MRRTILGFACAMGMIGGSAAVVAQGSGTASGTGTGTGTAPGLGTGTGVGTGTGIGNPALDQPSGTRALSPNSGTGTGLGAAPPGTPIVPQTTPIAPSPHIMTNPPGAPTPGRP